MYCYTNMYKMITVWAQHTPTYNTVYKTTYPESCCIPYTYILVYAFNFHIFFCVKKRNRSHFTSVIWNNEKIYIVILIRSQFCRTFHSVVCLRNMKFVLHKYSLSFVNYKRFLVSGLTRNSVVRTCGSITLSLFSIAGHLMGNKPNINNIAV